MPYLAKIGRNIRAFGSMKELQKAKTKAKREGRTFSTLRWSNKKGYHYKKELKSKHSKRRSSGWGTGFALPKFRF